MGKLKLDEKTLKKFGMTMFAAFLVISGVLFFRHKSGALPLLVISFMFLTGGMFLPHLLKPVYIGWMRLAFALGWVNTRIILIVLFYLIFTPIGLVMRLLRIDLLERSKSKGSYWKQKETLVFNPLDYERRF
ncbi:MAG: SxtJ family membrane protein [Candidatus Omnitrophota bacterium]